MSAFTRKIAGVLSDRIYVPFLSLGIAVSALIIFLGFFSYSVLRHQEDLLTRMAEQRGESLVRSIEASLQAGMRMRWRQDSLQAVVEEMGRARGVASLALVNEEGKVVAHSDKALVGQSPPALALLVRSAGQTTELIRTTGEEAAAIFSRRLRPGTWNSENPPAEQRMGFMQGRMPGVGSWESAGRLTAVVAIRTGEFQALRQQAQQQTMLIALVVGLLAAGAVYVGFVVQGYQLAHSNLRRLEQVRSALSKFVPQAVAQLLELKPAASLEKTEQDVTVMFLDIVGYTALSEEMQREELNDLVERYFARFLDQVHRHGGDVTETAGDGLMVLFRGDRPSDHARAAARAALDIDRVVSELGDQGTQGVPPIRLRTGINTGVALVGSTKIRGASSERWTFTATGLVTNVAARLCAHAAEGEILLGPETAVHLGKDFSLSQLGERQFKNVAAPVQVFRLMKEAVGGSSNL